MVRITRWATPLTPAPQSTLPLPTEDGNQRRKDDRYRDDRCFCRIEGFGERTLHVIVSANIPSLLTTPSTVSSAPPAVPALPPCVLSTANSACVTIMGSPGDSAVLVPLKNSAEAS